jgi:hypothetical protein
MTMEAEKPWQDLQLILGMPRSGKTSRAKTLVRHSPRVLYYDTKREDYADGWICDGLDELRRAWRGLYRQPKWRLVFRPHASTREERKGTGTIDPQFAAVSHMVRNCGGLAFVVEELHAFVGRDGRYDDAFEDLILCGQGHYDVGLVLVTQMPQSIGRAVLAMPDHWNIFKTFDARHIAFLRNQLCGVDEQDIRGLGQYQYIDYLCGADRYWIARDRPGTDEQELTEREYVYDRAKPTGTVIPGGNVVSVPAVEVHADDRPQDLPATRPQRTPLE